MSSSGNAAWRQLAGHVRSPPRSREIQAFETAVQRLLNGVSDPLLAGCWLDYQDGREPTWLPAPATVRGERSDYR